MIEGIKDLTQDVNPIKVNSLWYHLFVCLDPYKLDSFNLIN